MATIFNDSMFPTGDEEPAPTERVSLGTPSLPEQTTVSMDPDIKPTIPSLPLATSRATQASFAMAGLSNKTFDDYYSAFATGQEPWARRDAASTVDLFKAKSLQDKLPSLLTAAQGSSMPNWVIQQEIDKASQPTDPNSVFEERYAHQYMDTLNWAKPAPEINFWSDAVQKIPEDVTAGLGQGAEVLQYRSYVLKKLEDQMDAVKQQGWPGYLWDQFSDSIQLYKEIRERYAAGSGSLGAGSSHEEIRKSLLSQDFPTFKKSVDSITDSLSGNPSLAAEFLNDLAGMSRSDIALKNMFTLFAIPDAAALSKVAVGMTRGLVLRNQIKRAIRTAIESETSARSPAVVAPAAAGDLGEASATQVAGEITDTLKNVKSDPLKKGTEALVSGLRLNLEEAVKDPGNLGQEGVNRLKEDTLSLMNKVQNALTQVLKVERIPGFLAVKEAVKAYKEGLRDLYPGFKNAILDIKDPEWEPTSNTYRIPIHFGDGDKYFETPGQAYNKGVMEGLVPSEEPRMRSVNEHFGMESSKVSEQLRIAERELKEGPSMEADVNELNRHADTLPKQIAELKGKLDDLRAWHAEQLTNPENAGSIHKGPGFTVEQQGNGYYIRITKTLNETENIVRDALLKTRENWTPRGFFKDYLGWARTPEETMSDIQLANRKIASYAPSVFLKLMKEDHKYLTDLYRGVLRHDPITGQKISYVSAKASAIKGSFNREGYFRLDRFSQVVDLGRYLIDPETQKRGYFFKTPGEFERQYFSMFHVSPDPVETAAYFSFKRHYEADRIFREVILHKNASRLGAEEHQVVMHSYDGTEKSSDFFHGIQQKELPGGDDLVAIIERRGDDMHVLPTTSFAPKQAEKWRKMVSEGRLKVIKLFNSANRPLAGFGGIEDSQVVRYVIAPNINTRPLQLGNMLPRRGGGHVVYDYPKFIKQAKMSQVALSKERIQHWYEGDTTVMPITNGAMGEQIAKHLNQVRMYLKEEKPDQAKAYAQSNLPMGWQEVHSWFLPQRDAKGVLRGPRLSMDEPIQVVDRNQTIGQKNNDLANRYLQEGKSTFHDATLDGSPGEKFKVQFTGERDSDVVYTINDYGSKGNPLYKYEPAQMMDPMVTLNRSLKEISSSYFMDDYKIFSIEHWIQRAEKYIDTGRDKPQSSIRSSPFYYFYKGELKAGTPLAIRSSLNQERFKINSFVGTPGLVQQTLHSWSQSLADAIYEKAGPGPTIMGHRPYLAPSILLENITKPSDMLLRATYHATIGMWSFPQLLAQSMTYVTIHGIAGPTKAGPGTFGAMLHQYYRFNNAFIGSEAAEALDNIAVKMKLFRPGEWKEAVQLLERTGFDHVGPEHQILEKLYTPKVVQTKLDSFLNAGDVIFKGTERNARYGAWFTAYKEFRADNPTGRITNKDLAGILNRADLLSGNMSRASKSALQMGIGAFPTQFLGYNMRLAELATGSRMSKMQVARLATFWSMAFGLPNAMSLGGFPAGDYLRQYALENGYVVGDGFWKDMSGLGVGLSGILMEGLPATAIAYASGSGPLSNVKERLQSGKNINFGQRYGSPGVDMIRQAFSNDKPWYQLMAGAPGTFMDGIIQHTNKYLHNATALMSGNPVPFKMKVEDLIEPLRAISTVNYLYRGMIAANTGMWMSKNENILEGGPNAPESVSKTAALLMTLSGTQPTEVADLNNWSIINKNQQAFQKDIRTQFIKEYHRYMQAIVDGDLSNAEDYLKNAYAYVEVIGNYPIEKRDQLLKDAESSYDEMVSRLESGVLTRNVPTDTLIGGRSRPAVWQDIAERMRMLQEKRGQQ